MHCLHHVMELKEKELSEMKTLLLLKQLPSPKRQRRFVCISIVIVKWGGEGRRVVAVGRQFFENIYADL